MVFSNSSPCFLTVFQNISFAIEWFFFLLLLLLAYPSNMFSVPSENVRTLDKRRTRCEVAGLKNIYTRWIRSVSHFVDPSAVQRNLIRNCLSERVADKKPFLRKGREKKKTIGLQISAYRYHSECLQPPVKPSGRSVLFGGQHFNQGCGDLVKTAKIMNSEKYY